MTDDQQIILMVDDHMPEETRQMLQGEIERSGLRHVLIVVADLLGASRINDMVEDFRRMQLRMTQILPPSLMLLESFEAAPLPPYYQRFSPQLRRAESNLAAHYNHSAKWGSGAHNAGHRSRENRRAEAQRNAMAHNK